MYQKFTIRSLIFILSNKHRHSICRHSTPCSVGKDKRNLSYEITSSSFPYLILFKRKKHFEITSRKPSGFPVCRSMNEYSIPKQKKIKGNHKPHLRHNHNLHFNFFSTFFSFFRYSTVTQIPLKHRSLLYLLFLFPILYY